MKKIILKLFIMSHLLLNSQSNGQLIDRELFFGNPEITGAQLSPDGKYLTFLKEYEGIMNLWIKKVTEPFDKAVPLTNQKRPMYGYFWTDDSKNILFVKDQDGDENINIFALDPYKGKLPEARNLTPMKDVLAIILMVSKKDPNILMIGLNDRDKKWHDLYKLSINDGKMELVYKNTDRVTGFDFDWDENLRVVSKTDEQGNTKMYNLLKDGTLDEIYSTNVKESAKILGWTADNSQFYLETNKGELDKSELFLMNPTTKNIEFVERDPSGKVDFGSIMFDKNTRKIIYTLYVQDKQKILWKDKTWEDNYNFLKQKFPGREIDIYSATNDYSKLLISTSSDRYIPEVYSFDTKTRELIFQYTPRPKLKAIEDQLVEMKPYSYKSSDGLEIPAYLTLPKSYKKGTPVPLVAFIHGGPKGPRDYWGFNSTVQFLANRGFAVLQPNFRASGGYGKHFMNAGDLQWGKLMQDDITWGVNQLVKDGIADKNKLVIMGGSYGGYATLAGLAFTPDLYTCGIDIVGPSNLFTLIESIPPYWEAGRAMLYQMVGNPETEEGKNIIKEASPLFSVDKIKKPLLVVHGANDPRVKQAEADQIVVALRDKGKRVDYLLAKDEGHGFTKPLNNMAMYTQIERFLGEIIGTPYQKDVKPEVAEKLKEIKVDIQSVKLKEKTPATALTNELPPTENFLKEGLYTYKMKVEVQGQTLPMEMTRTIKKNGENFEITDATNGMMGESKDQVLVTKNLKAISRTMSQGGLDMEMDFYDDKIIAKTEDKTKELKIDGAYLLDGPTMDIVLAGMEWKEGMEFNCLQPDAMSMKHKTINVKCLGLENSLLKISVTNTENEVEQSIFWIDTTQKMAKKMEAILPAMMNAKLTIERN